MEKFNPSYRDKLADDLKEIRNSNEEKPELAKAEAKGYLDAAKQTREYKEAKNAYITKVNKDFESRARIEMEEEKKERERKELLGTEKTCQIITFEGKDYLLHKDFLKTKQPLVVETESENSYSSDELPDYFPEGEDRYLYSVFYKPSDEMIRLSEYLTANGHKEEFAKLEKILEQMINEAPPIQMRDPLRVNDRFYQKRRPFPDTRSLGEQIKEQCDKEKEVRERLERRKRKA